MNPSMRPGLWPFFADKIDQVLAQAADLGLPPCDVFMGWRTWSKQDELYALGRTVKNADGFSPEKPLGDTVTNAKGGESWHNYGVAVDLVFRPGGKWSWDYHGLPYGELGKIGQSLGLEWGGAWAAPLHPDQPHLELRAGLIIGRAAVLYQEGGIEAVWKEIEARLAA